MSKRRKHEKYDPSTDSNLLEILDEILSVESATLLILVPHSRHESRGVVDHLAGSTSPASPDRIFLDFSRRSVDVYDSSGTRIESVAACVDHTTKAGAIDKAIQRYIATKYIIIVARREDVPGISFFSEDGTRHLSHQYIVEPGCCDHLLNLHHLSLAGIYNDKPDLTLYCSNELHERFQCQDQEMKQFMALAKEVGGDRARMHEVMEFQKEYSRKWGRNERGE